mmetsp:Transcript_6940/g.10372  ORF Transcript_6940/g.10372 Transcript_6940/m.10372 type:complete len:107 (-) Transcript_6940:93-413(-)
MYIIYNTEKTAAELEECNVNVLYIYRLRFLDVSSPSVKIFSVKIFTYVQRPCAWHAFFPSCPRWIEKGARNREYRWPKMVVQYYGDPLCVFLFIPSDDLSICISSY